MEECEHAGGESYLERAPAILQAECNLRQISAQLADVAAAASVTLMEEAMESALAEVDTVAAH